MKLPPVDFDLDLEVDAQLDRLRPTDLVEVKQENQVEAGGIVLHPPEHVRGWGEVSKEVRETIDVDDLVTVYWG